jgi:hypothetical protein
VAGYTRIVVDHPDKICAACGRSFAYRKKWARSWDSVRYCSERCRGARPGDADLALEQAILDLCAERPRDATICPSEAARAVFEGERWRDEMERARQAARRLVARGLVEITQRGQVVDPDHTRGPIRIRRV